MPRDEKGRFVKEGLSIQFPPILSILKYLIVSIIIYPWYYVLMKSGKIDRIMGSIFTIDNSLGNSQNLGNSQSSTLSKTEAMMGSKK